MNTIGNLTPAVAVNGTDLVEIEQEGVSKRALISMIGGSGGASLVQPGATTIQEAMATATAGDTIQLTPGVYDLTSLDDDGYILIPDNVNLVGAGPELTIIKSQRDCFASPGTGIVAPGTNSVIQDLAIKAISATGNGNENCNPLAARGAGGFTKNYNNAIYRNCYLFGLNDCIINVAAVLGDTTFINCTIEGQCDVIMWQCNKKLILNGCHIIHTTPANLTSIGCTMLCMCDDNGSVKIQNCRMTVRGAALDDFAGIYALENVGTNSYIEVNDLVLDWQGYIPPSSKDVQNWGTAMYLNNVVRADGKALTVDASANPVNSAKNCILSVAVAKLPSAPGVGDEAWVTDGTASLAWGATVTGGASTKYKVMWNGTNWTVMGK